MRRRAIILAGALSLFIGVDSAEAKLEILVEKASQRMVVIQDGYMRYIWPVSTGRDALETPNGTYRPQRLERSWFSSAYYNSPMPYSIFFHNGYAIHGSTAINQLGGPASHGCVRLHPHHASLLFGLVQQEGRENTIIEVTDEPLSDMQPRPPRESEQARQMYLAEPRPERLGEFSDMAEVTGGQRGNRPAIARTPLPVRAPPADRRQLTSLVETVNQPRATCAGPDCRPRTKSAEAPPRERTETAQVARSAPPTHTEQPAQPAQGFKVLPASCWSGGAARWRWWRSSQETSCK